MTELAKKYKYIISSSKLEMNKVNIQWQLTDWCNYNCPYCIQAINHQYDTKPKETQEVIFQRAYKIREGIKNKLVRFSMHGGEVSFHYDLKTLSEILFKDNNITGSYTLTTNLSAPIENYNNFFNADVGDVKQKISASYQWVNLDNFIDKYNSIEGNKEASIVVYPEKTLEEIYDVYYKFKKNNIVFRFTHGREPGSHKMFDLNKDIIDFITKSNEENFSKYASKVIYNDNTEKLIRCRADLLIELSNYLKSNYINMFGMKCFSGIIIYPSGKVYSGACSCRKSDYIGNLDIDKISFKNKMYICPGGASCNLCGSELIWNGKF